VATRKAVNVLFDVTRRITVYVYHINKADLKEIMTIERIRSRFSATIGQMTVISAFVPVGTPCMAKGAPMRRIPLKAVSAKDIACNEYLFMSIMGVM
jgi:hypothetical protein